MKTLELRTADGRCIARHVRMACSFQSRCVGLLRQSTLPAQEGLLLVPGGSIHTLGMRYAIDVVFLNRQMRIVGLSERVPPWRIRVAPRGTRCVLELAAGQIAATWLTLGIYLVVEAPSAPSDKSNWPTVNLRGTRRPPCERLPIQFSLRLPLARRRCTSPIPAMCSAGTIASYPLQKRKGEERSSPLPLGPLQRVHAPATFAHPCAAEVARPRG